jgi:anti-anti-sigma regulatory factor
MTTTAEVQKVNGENVEQALDDVRRKLAGTEGGVILDFSAVQRVDHGGLRAMEDLANAADEKSVEISLEAVNVGVYKVLKLGRLTLRFSFVN